MFSGDVVTVFPRVKLLFTLLVFIILPTQTFAQQTKLLILGDSLSAGYGLKQEESWPLLLQNTLQPLNIQIINGSVSGETSAGGLSRIPRLIEVHKPTHLLIELGGNDGLRGYPVPKMQENIEKIVDIATSNNIETYIQQIRIPPSYGKRYTQLFANTYSNIADKYQLPLIPFFLDDIALNSDLMQSDGIHPNLKAQPMIAEFMQKQLEPLLLSSKTIK